MIPIPAIESLSLGIYNKPLVSKLWISLGLTVLLVTGCSQQNPEFEQEQSSADIDYVVSEQAVVETQAEALDSIDPDSKAEQLSVKKLSDASDQTLSTQAADINIAGKKLLITASANFKVEDVVNSSAAIESLTYQQGGYVASSTIHNRERDSRFFIEGNKSITITSYDREAEMEVRIPKANVNKFLKQLQQQVEFLTAQTFSAQDVTLDIYRQQLATTLNKDMTSELNQQRLDSKDGEDQSSNVDAITATYAARQQQEYAQLEQMNIADRIKYSTITLTFNQPDISYKETTQDLDFIMAAERPSFGSQAAQAFKQGWESLREVTITLIRLWWLAIVVGAFYILYKLIKALYRRFFISKRDLNDKKRLTKRKPETKILDNK